MNTVAIEKDWVVTLYKNNQTKLIKTNSVIRRIDLVSKVIAPIFIGFIIDFDKSICIYFVGLFNIVGLLLELYLVRSLYNNNEELSRSKELNRQSNLRSTYVKMLMYVEDKTFLVSLSAAILYLTVLSFSGSMIGYFKWCGYSDTFVAFLRSIAVAMGIIATFLQPDKTRASCEAEFHDEYCPIFEFRSDLTGIQIELPDSYEYRQALYSKFLENVRKWLY